MSRECRIALEALEHIVAHAREARPAECCGSLIGSGTTITEAVRARNASEDPNRFLIDPQAHIEARREARGRDLEVLGFYHSHPHTLPEPSATDLREASYPDHLYLIVSPATDPAEIRLFRLVAGNFLGVPFIPIR